MSILSYMKETQKEESFEDVVFVEAGKRGASPVLNVKLSHGSLELKHSKGDLEGFARRFRRLHPEEPVGKAAPPQVDHRKAADLNKNGLSSVIVVIFGLGILSLMLFGLITAYLLF